MKQKGEDRKVLMKAQNKEYKEVSERKPLYLKYEEQFKLDFVAKDLAEQKKALEDKRNFIN